MPAVTIEIEELRIVRAANGKMNLLGLKVFHSSGGGEKSKAKTSELPFFRMDTVTLSLNRVTYTDLSTPAPVQQSFRVGIQNAVLGNQPSLEMVVETIVQESIRAAGLQKMLDEAIRAFGLRSFTNENAGWKSLVAKVKEAL